MKHIKGFILSKKRQHANKWFNVFHTNACLNGGFQSKIMKYSPKIALPKIISFLAACSLVFLSCSQENSEELEEFVILDNRLDSVYLIAKEIYYWQDHLPSKDKFTPNQYEAPGEILRAFRSYSPDQVDRWSFAIPSNTWRNSTQGTIGNFGIGLKFHKNNDLRIAWVHRQSSADQMGLHRGMRVLKVNDIDASNENAKAITSIINEETEITLKVIYQEVSQEISIRKTVYPQNPILTFEVFEYEQRKVGYLNFFSFTSKVERQLPEIFASIAQDEVPHLIVDLRYNGGGFLNVMEALASHIIPEEYVSEIMYQKDHNKVYQDFDSKVFFTAVSNPSPIKKVSFITTSRTSSASEMLIQILKPYMEVNVIGQQTDGKLMGMYNVPYDGHILSPISFRITNVLGHHDNFLGLSPDIFEIDDLEHDFSLDEACIKRALSAEPHPNQNNRLATQNFPLIVESHQLISGAMAPWRQ